MEPRPLPRDSHGRPQLVFGDLVVGTSWCNFRCDYCLASEAPRWAAPGVEGREAAPRPSLEPGSPLAARLQRVMARFARAFHAVNLRISGGEIFHLAGAMGLLQSACADHEVVQVITNGSLLTDQRIGRLRQLAPLHLHISLDGHTVELNRHRVRSAALQQRLLDSVDRVVAAGIPLELGAVLSGSNTAAFADFLEYLLRHEGRLAVYPFPVRGEAARRFGPGPQDVAAFCRLLDQYPRYAGVLAPLPYIEALVELLRQGRRQLRCAVPRTMIQLFDDGSLSACPNGWACQVGNVLSQPPEELARRFGQHKIYNVMLQPRPRLRFCHGCFTSLDVLSLHAAGLLSEAQLSAIPLYHGPRTRAALARFS